MDINLARNERVVVKAVVGNMLCGTCGRKATYILSYPKQSFSEAKCRYHARDSITHAQQQKAKVEGDQGTIDAVMKLNAQDRQYARRKMAGAA